VGAAGLVVGMAVTAGAMVVAGTATGIVDAMGSCGATPASGVQPGSSGEETAGTTLPAGAGALPGPTDELNSPNALVSTDNSLRRGEPQRPES
jgi:hypothetical protein